MRAVIFDQIKKVMKEDERYFFLTGDTGFNLVEDIFEMAPKRAINVGVAEQNLVGIAAGLCNAGYIPICYAITNFIVHRCFEQMRNDICMHKHKAIFVGTSTGFDNGALGSTHHMLDDISCLKAFPNLNIYSPSGRKSMDVIWDEAIHSSVASFIRVTKSDYTEVNDVVLSNHFISGQGQHKDTVIISHGRMIKSVIEALQKQGDFAIFAMDQVKPLDEGVLKGLFSDYQRVIVVEDNFRSGLYNSISQWVVDNQMRKNEIHSIHPPECFEVRIGDTQYFEKKYGLLPEQLSSRIQSIRSQQLTQV